MKSIYSKSIPRFDKPSPQFKKTMNAGSTPYIEQFDVISIRKVKGYDLPKLNPSNETNTNPKDIVRTRKRGK